VAVAEWSLASSAFAVGGTIPRRHTCDGEDRSPPLSWTAPPRGGRSLALILDDPDAPGGRFVHWLAWGIPPDAGGLAEGEAAPREGRNDFGTPSNSPNNLAASTPPRRSWAPPGHRWA
jgi:Raf kinase inhibitor-like YbhB/YbcL family protein